jgi:hypothetical protein
MRDGRHDLLFFLKLSHNIRFCWSGLLLLGSEVNLILKITDNGEASNLRGLEVSSCLDHCDFGRGLLPKGSILLHRLWKCMLNVRSELFYWSLVFFIKLSSLL